MTQPVPSEAIAFAHDSGSPEIVWRPDAHYIERSRLRRFMERYGIESVAALLQRAEADIAWFWDAVVQDLELEWFEPYEQVLDLAAGVEWPRWFVGGRYNYVHDAVDKQAQRLRPAATAIAWEGEDGATRSLNFAELSREVNRAANALRELGIGFGDRVGIFMPMIPETAIAKLAVSKIGAIYIPIFSGYGGAAVASRLEACGAKLLITADGFWRGGKQVAMKKAADEAVALCPTVEHTLVVRRLGGAAPWSAEQDIWWDELVDRQSAECETVQTSAADPYMIIYTSGTTGKPKGIVHTQGGFPIKAAQELAHCFDLHAGERLFWVSDIGWMMGPWSICGSLMLGATCFLYEGGISYPQPDRIWDMVERHRITHLGVSPTAVRALMGQGDQWVAAHDLSSLEILAGAGEPWNPEPWRWLFDTAGKGKKPIINYSGGTEVSGAILSCNTLLPLKPCAFSAPAPGMSADVVDAAGHSVRGMVGELAIRQPWVGITQGFWQDPERYIDTYWSRVPGLWVHGDWARIDDDGFWYILGRSDDTIKVAGKRVGPAELESAAISYFGVAESAAVGVPDTLKGEVALLFVVLRPGFTANEATRQEIEAAIVGQLGKTLKPQAIYFVPDLPHTRNGKIMRRLVRQSFLDLPLGDTSALENPASLEAIQEVGAR